MIIKIPYIDAACTKNNFGPRNEESKKKKDKNKKRNESNR